MDARLNVKRRIIIIIITSYILHGIVLYNNKFVHLLKFVTMSEKKMYLPFHYEIEIKFNRP